MLTIVTWRWLVPGYRSTYGPQTVNTLKRMVDRSYRDPHRFVCVTDDPKGLDPDVEVVPIWNDFDGLPHPSGPRYPSCYRRLRAFHPEIGAVFGDRFVSMDLDCVITGDMRSVWNRPEPFVGWNGTHARNKFNGSMFLMSAGARPHVWTEFDPRNSPRRAEAAGYYGTDQAWISLCLDKSEASWSTKDGVYSYRLHVEPAGDVLPDNAKVIFWNGKKDPWDSEMRELEWVQTHYR
jgi:hypothetical protein